MQERAALVKGALEAGPTPTGFRVNNREIAERLFVTEATVKTHINNIFGKTGLRDRAQAVVYAIRHGLAAEP